MMTSYDSTGKTEKTSSAQLIGEIDKCTRKYGSWYRRVKDIVKLYLAKGDAEFCNNDPRKQFNILWSNVQILQPVLYSRTPTPEIKRRFGDRDQNARIASDLLERATKTAMEDGGYDLTMRRVRDDALLGGRGVARVSYCVEFGAQISNELSVIQGVDGAFYYADGTPFDGDMNLLVETGDTYTYTDSYEPIEKEEIKYEYVHWTDFGHSDARIWEEVEKVWFAAYLSKAEVKKRFGEEIANSLNFDQAAPSLNDETDRKTDKIKIFEVWCKSDKTVRWVTQGCDTVLDEIKDPLGLNGFFPCPRPLYFTQSNDTLVPTADFDQYETWANILNECTRRIEKLTKAIKRRGVYDPSCIDLERLTNELSETELVPAKDWPTLAQRGGLDGFMQFLPVEELVRALNEMYIAFDKAQGKIYELIGISDIVRGNTAPSETATAQQRKSEFFSLRVSERQKEVQRFARDLMALGTEVIAEHFSDETLISISGAEYLAEEDPIMYEKLPEIIELVRDDKIRQFRIKIQTDSTLAEENSVNQQAVNDSIQSISSFLSNILPLVSAEPNLRNITYKMLAVMTRSLKAGKDFESAIQDLTYNAEQQEREAQIQAQQPQEPTEPEIDPAILAKIAATQETEQLRISMQQQKNELEAEIKRNTLYHNQQMDLQKIQYERDIEEAKLMLKAEIERMKATIASEERRERIAFEASALMGVGDKTTEKTIVKGTPYGAEEVSTEIVKTEEAQKI